MYQHPAALEMMGELHRQELQREAAQARLARLVPGHEHSQMHHKAVAVAVAMLMVLAIALV